MPSHHNESTLKNQKFMTYNNMDYHLESNLHSDNKNNTDSDEDLVTNFDCEILDLDEERYSEDEQDMHITNKKPTNSVNKHNLDMLNKPKSNLDIYTMIGTNCFGKKVPYLIFSVEAVLRKDSAIKTIGEKYNLSYKIHKTDCRLLKTILNSHGFQECQLYSNDYNLLWTGGHVKPYTLRTMSEFQKINHFPRSHELTRKDRLFKNIQKMQQLKGLKHFDFVPSSYLIPSEFQELCHNFSKEKGTYIVKPIAMSRGRGIFLSNHPGQIPLDEQLIASKYISNPYIINDLKFDIRMYVLVTSFDPLVAYLYEEGLTRFATVKYQNTPKNLKTQCMHLTNYSVNKKSDNFIQNDDADIEDFGNKWSLGALLRYLKSKGIDTTCLMMKIEDIIVKSLITVEAPISATCRMFQSYRSNCFELYGYDIIIDENLRPWLLEVNLSPSLSCDSPLDFKIKSHMMSDLFSLIGIGCEEPNLNNQSQTYSNGKSRSTLNSYSSTESKIPKQMNNQNSANRRPSAGLRRRDITTSAVPFKSDQLRMTRRVKEEYKRRGGWIRIFPTVESLETYFPLFQSCNTDTTNIHFLNNNQMSLNKLLYFKLYPNYNLESDVLNRSTSQSLSNFKSRLSLHSVNYNSSFHNGTLSQLLPSSQITYKRVSQNYSDTQSRIPFYERKLGEEAIISSNCQENKNPGSMDKNKIPVPEINEINQDSDNEMMSSNSSISISDKEDGLENSDSEIDVEDEEYASTNSHNIPSSMSQSFKDVLSIEKLIKMGGQLSKFQARMAFSSYLTKVQRRLFVESRSEESKNSMNANDSHEQLELVLRFLKRAASNMSPEEFVIPPTIPSRSLSLSQRQEWLAKLLGSFIKIYSRETELADMKPNESTDKIDRRTFLLFLRQASEGNLEQTLSNYTRLNKSAGIFLNPNLNPHHNQAVVDDKIKRSPAVGLHKFASMTNLSTKEKSSSEANLKYQTQISKSTGNKTQLSWQVNADNSIPNQQPYNRPLSVNQTPWRPGSTRLTNNNSRPISSHAMSNHTRPGSKTEKPYDADAVSKALQRLAMDQRNRQLTASVFSVYDTDSDHSNLLKKPANFDPLAQTLIRQYQQSKQLLQESRAKHNALLMQNSTNGSDIVPMTNPKTQLIAKPPPGMRSSQTMRLPCPTRKLVQ